MTFKALGKDDNNLAITVTDSATEVFADDENLKIEITEGSGVTVLKLQTVSNGNGGAVDSVNGETGTVVLDTDDISEGTTNQYYTDARVDAHLTGGTGVTYTAGTIAIGQEVNTTSDVTFNTVTSDLYGAIHLNVKNDEGAAISQGDPVYFKGVSGNNITVGVADADDPAKMPAFGIAATDANNNATLDIVTSGKLSGIDTSAYSVNDELYVSATNGLTTTRPTGADDAVQKVARVERVHASNGSIYVMGAGRSNDVPNNIPVYGDIIGKTGDLNITNEVDGSGINIKVDDAGGTTQTGAVIGTDDYTLVDDTTGYKTFIQNNSAGLKIGAGEFSSTGNTPDNGAGDYELNGINIIPTGNSWPSVSLFSTGESVTKNPLYDRTGSASFQQFPNANILFGAANGVVGSESALDTGKRVGQLAFTVHDGVRYGGSASRASADLQVESIETASSSNDRAVNMKFSFMPAGGDGSTSSRTTVLELREDRLRVTPEGTEVFKALSDAVEIHGLVYPNTDGTNGQVLTTDGSGNLTFEDAAGGGLTASTTPTLSGDSTAFSDLEYTLTISNHSSAYDLPQYRVEVIQDSGSVQKVDPDDVTDNGDGTLTFTMPSTTGAHTIKVKAQDFGNGASAEATLAVTLSALSFTNRYYRVKNFDTDITSIMFAEFRLYDAISQGGTKYPTNMTSNSAPSPYVASGTGRYSTTYDYFKAFDGNNNTQYWNLASSTHSTDFLAIDLGSSAPTIKSFSFRSGTSLSYVGTFDLFRADSSDFSDEVKIATLEFTAANQEITLG